MNPQDLYIEFIIKNIKEILPIVIEKDGDYLPKLKKELKKYSDLVSNEEVLNKHKENIDALIASIEKSIELYYAGKISAAYEELKTFTDVFEGFNGCKRKMKDIADGHEYKTLYRGRVAEEITALKEMFHRPFNQRPYIPTERFSIPGLPCLYLAGSVFTCWHEIGKPNFNDFYVSRFEADDTVTVLDLAMHPRDCKLGIYDSETYCIIWPLICACSFKVKEKDRGFRSEYIIPQLLMQIVINSNDVDGIRYLSSHQPKKTLGPSAPLYVNYAFPAPYETKKSYSTVLASKFKATSAICLHEYNQLSPSNLWTVKHYGREKNKAYKLPDKYQNFDRRSCAIKTCMDKYSEYADTTYFNIEELLYQFEAERIRI